MGAVRDGRIRWGDVHGRPISFTTRLGVFFDPFAEGVGHRAPEVEEHPRSFYSRKRPPTKISCGQRSRVSRSQCGGERIPGATVADGIETEFMATLHAD